MVGIIWRIQGVTSKKKLAEFELHDGKAVMKTKSSSLAADIRTRGIVGRMGKVFHLKDGEDFIRELPFAFTGTYVRGEVIENE